MGFSKIRLFSLCWPNELVETLLLFNPVLLANARYDLSSQGAAFTMRWPTKLAISIKSSKSDNFQKTVERVGLKEN